METKTNREINQEGEMMTKRVLTPQEKRWIKDISPYYVERVVSGQSHEEAVLSASDDVREICAKMITSDSPAVKLMREALCYQIYVGAHAAEYNLRLSASIANG